ncbi:hypothetical protein J8J42_02410 [Chryseobacterium sp. cx-311]|nr:hypothetical protein [Marnyiella aurantia]MBP0611896.1 hypothetical protein [Marnyiella aurantia]
MKQSKFTEVQIVKITNDWRDKIKINYHNPTEIYVGELINTLPKSW